LDVRWTAPLAVLIGTGAWAGPLEEVRDLFEAGRYGEARVKVEVYLESHPDDPEGLYWRGELEPDARVSQGYYRKLLRLCPEHPLAARARLRTAQYLYVRGKYRAALEQLRRIAEDFPDHSLALCWAGRALMAAGEPGKARREFLRALSNARTPEDSLRALVGLSEACLGEGLWEEALHCAETASSLPGSRDWARFLSDRIAICRKRLEELRRPEVLKGYVLQVGAFRGEAQARRRCEELRKAGYAAWVKEKQVRGERWYAVWVGPYTSREEAKRASKAFSEAWVLKIP